MKKPEIKIGDYYFEVRWFKDASGKRAIPRLEKWTVVKISPKGSSVTVDTDNPVRRGQTICMEPCTFRRRARSESEAIKEEYDNLLNSIYTDGWCKIDRGSPMASDFASFTRVNLLMQLYDSLEYPTVTTVPEEAMAWL